MAALTKSPAGPGARRSSGSDKLRPVLPFGLDDVDYNEVDEEERDELGPVPREGPGNPAESRGRRAGGPSRSLDRAHQGGLPELFGEPSSVGAQG